MKQMVITLGQPEDYLLATGKNTHRYFKQDPWWNLEDPLAWRLLVEKPCSSFFVKSPLSNTLKKLSSDTFCFYRHPESLRKRIPGAPSWITRCL